MSRDPLIGRTLSIYRIERLLGRGGMASVYFGRDTSLQRPVAIKVMAERYRDNPAFAQRFISEARAVASWRHEHIVQVFYAGREDDLSFFAMEYIDGMDLAALLRVYAGEGELMPRDDVLQISRAVASALDFAHERGVIHRDVKPSNVMISTEDRVVLTDFGLALDTAQGSLGEVFGTPTYIAPEQARRSADAVPQSDLYSLGVMLYEMLVGAVPFDDPSPAAVALQHLTQPPPAPRTLNPALNEATEQVLLQALSKDATDRYATGAALIDALATALHDDSSVLPLETLDLPFGSEGETTGRLLSARSVAERVALHSQTMHTAERPEEARIPSTEHGAATPDAQQRTEQPPTRPAAVPPRRRPALLAGATAAAIIAVILLALILSNAGRQPVATLVAIASPGEPPPSLAATTAPPTRTLGALIVLATPEFTLAPPVTTPASLTATPTAQPPTATAVPPTLTPSATDLPPATEPATPPATAAPASATAVPILPTEAPTLPTSTDASPPVTAAPTVLYPDGRPLALIWDDSTFYLRNPGTESTDAPVRIDFEALDAAGNPLPYAFDGGRWAAIFGRIQAGGCDSIEITQSAALNPPECRVLNARITPQRGSDMVFWLPRDGATQFRVLWAGQEIGRCPLEAGACEVRAP